MANLSIAQLISDFAGDLAALIEAQTLERARASVNAALGVGEPARRGRPPKNGIGGARPRRKAPIQLCPVPGCKNPAAPIFGMVCAKHKDVPKAKIKKYREARKAKKLKGLK
jgi:hypothetical protein